MCLLKGIAPRNPQDLEREVETSSGSSQAPMSTVEARRPTAPSEVAQNAWKTDLNSSSSSLSSSETPTSVRAAPGLSATVPSVPRSPPNTHVSASAQEEPYKRSEPAANFSGESERAELPRTVDASSGLRRASESVHTPPSLPTSCSTPRTIIPMSADTPSVPNSIYIDAPSLSTEIPSIPITLNFGGSQTVRHSFRTRPPRRAPSPIVANHSRTIPSAAPSPPLSVRAPVRVDPTSACTDSASTRPKAGIGTPFSECDSERVESANTRSERPSVVGTVSNLLGVSESIPAPSTSSICDSGAPNGSCDVPSTPSTSETCGNPLIVSSASPESPGVHKIASTVSKPITPISVTPSARVSRHSSSEHPWSELKVPRPPSSPFRGLRNTFPHSLAPAPVHWQTQWQPRTSFLALFQHLALSVTKSGAPHTSRRIPLTPPSTYDTPRVSDLSRASPASVLRSPSPTLDSSDSTTTLQLARHPERNTVALFSRFQAPEPSEEVHRASETSDIAHAASKDDPTPAPEIPSAPPKSKANYCTTTKLLIRKSSFQHLVRGIAHTMRTFLGIPGTSSVIPSSSDMAGGPDSPSNSHSAPVSSSVASTSGSYPSDNPSGSPISSPVPVRVIRRQVLRYPEKEEDIAGAGLSPQSSRESQATPDSIPMLPGGRKSATIARQEEDFSAFPHPAHSILLSPRFRPDLRCASGAQSKGSNTSDPRPRIRVQDALPPAQAPGLNWQLSTEHMRHR